MQNETLLALMLDPFLTFDEIVKQVEATPTPAGKPRPTPSRPAAPSRPSKASRRPIRIGVPSVPVIHHPPATVG